MDEFLTELVQSELPLDTALLLSTGNKAITRTDENEVVVVFHSTEDRYNVFIIREKHVIKIFSTSARFKLEAFLRLWILNSSNTPSEEERWFAL